MPRASSSSIYPLATLVAFALFGCKNDEPSPSESVDSTSPSAGGSPAQGGLTNSTSLSSRPLDSGGGSSSAPEVGLGGADTSVGGRPASTEKTSSGGQRSSVGTPAAGGHTSTSSGKSSGSTGNGGENTSSRVSAGGTRGSNQTQSSTLTASGGTSAKTGAVGGSVAAGGSKASTSTTGNGTSPITIWIAGDSTVQTCSSACPCGWGGPFASYFNSNVKVSNQAISGRSIQTWMYEPNVGTSVGSDGECTTEETNSARFASVANGIKSGDYLFIQFGINDGDKACPRHVGSERYKTLLTRLAKLAIDRGAHPVLLTATSMIRCSGSTAVASRGFLTETAAVGAALEVPVIDLHALSIALYNQRKFCPLPAGNTDVSASTGGEVGAFFCDDHTHFDAAGALAIAGVVAQALRDQAIPLAAYLK